MSPQADYVVANGTGAAVRSDINGQLAAIVSNNSGATEPATMYAYQWWADTTTGLLKIRNAANNGWVTVGTLASANLGLLASAGTLTAALGSASTPGITFTGDTNTGIYSPGADQVAVATSGTGRLFVDSSGRVGLGTSSPGTNFELRGSGASIAGVNTHALISDSTTAASGVGGSILFEGNYTSGGARAAFGAIAGTKENGTDSDYAGNLKFYTRANGSLPALAMTITSSQRVGIGSTAPGMKLTINDTTTAQIQLGYSDSIYGRIGRNSSGNYEFSSYESGSNLLFGTTTSTGSTTERARIDSSGRLLVGTSSSVSSTALIQAYKPSGELQCVVNSGSLGNAEVVVFTANAGGRLSQFGAYKHSGITNPCSYYYLEQQNGAGQVFWVDDSGNFRLSTSGGNIGTTGGTVVGTQTSDERLKNILGPVTYGLGTLKQIEPVRYTLKSQPDIEQLGFIAQQVQPLVPQSVFDTNEHIEGEPEDAPTKLGMEYVALIPVLVNAVKELSAEVDALKAQLQAL